MRATSKTHFVDWNVPLSRSFFFNEMFDLLILTYSRPQKYVVKVKVKWRLSEGNVSSFSNLFNLYVYLKTEKLDQDGDTCILYCKQ